MSNYNMPSLGLFGKRCRIKHVSNMKEGFVYRIVESGIVSNVWKELPFGRIPNENVTHNYSEKILIVVCDTLIDDKSELERVRLKDVEIMDEPLQEPYKQFESVLSEIKDELHNPDKDTCDPFVLECVDEIIDKYEARIHGNQSFTATGTLQDRK